MKKSQKILAALLSLCAAGGVAAIAAYLLRLPPEQEDALIERIRTFAVERAAPLAVALLSGVALILALLTPAVNRVRDAAGRFHDAVPRCRAPKAAPGKRWKLWSSGSRIWSGYRRRHCTTCALKPIRGFPPWRSGWAVVPTGWTNRIAPSKGRHRRQTASAPCCWLPEPTRRNWWHPERRGKSA